MCVDIFADDEQSQKIQKSNKTLVMMPRIDMGVELKQQVPLVIDLEEVDIAGKVGSPNSTLSSATCKRLGGFSGERDMISDDEGDNRGGCGGGGGGERGERKKLRLSKEQIMVLEQAFREHTTLNTKQKVALANQVNLRPRQVEVWFQNRRARTKLKQTEVDCEYLRTLCESLTEENKQLQKEVHELRTLNVSSEQSFIHSKLHPPTTLTMCPSCKTASLSSSSATTKSPTNDTGRYPAGVFTRRPIPHNLKKLSLTLNSNRMFEAHLPRS
ncbi:homeobox-leucine zipper protein ATHB-4 [Beta vulgaris subsp. vulgaris]|uniref:homeobox-leucine zipper protein ATHB-4 n=1 Tax=Beta vulgaris subsp. vulgaris TaxID=3555 RepID=UPI002546B9FA|nr:homeobox-leucine zipper protein ATHB-4 [Beta vulgaris subsp. vulgaris]